MSDARSNANLMPSAESQGWEGLVLDEPAANKEESSEERIDNRNPAPELLKQGDTGPSAEKNMEIYFARCESGHERQTAQSGDGPTIHLTRMSLSALKYNPRYEPNGVTIPSPNNCFHHKKEGAEEPPDQQLEEIPPGPCEVSWSATLSKIDAQLDICN